MVRHVEAVFSQGAFRPLVPLTLPEGTRVQLRVEDQTGDASVPPAAKIRTPRLARPEDAAEFVMEVRETGDAGV
jgi:predicted DNA-binding antitoxin AbrB/MazE fold protein